LSIGSIFSSVGNFLFSRTNREVVIFLFFLALSGIFWLMMRLNESYEQEVKIVIRYVNAKKNIVLTSGETDTLRVVISDKGFNILSYLYGQTHRPLAIDFPSHVVTSGTGSVGSSDIRKIVEKELPASSKVISIKPDKLVFYFNNGESKRVPVVFRGSVSAQPLYFVASKELSPDSVTVYASRQKLDSIKAVYTEERNYDEVSDTLTVRQKLTPIAGAKIVPDHVYVSFVTDVLAEVRIDNIPIEGINMPEGKKLRTFPAKTSVHFVTGMKLYQGLKPEDFSIVADYNEFGPGQSQKCNIYIKNTPKGISNATLDINQVDYLIEGTTR
jgi:hypothetical protein